jgi:hypothetical protein
MTVFGQRIHNADRLQRGDCAEKLFSMAKNDCQKNTDPIERSIIDERIALDGF